MWNYWSTRELQEEIGDDNLDFLEATIPELANSERSYNFIDNRNQLAQIVESLMDHNYFRNSLNLEKCIRRIPKENLTILCNEINYEKDINNSLEIAKKILSENSFYEIFIKIFDLDARFLSVDAIKKEPFFDNFSASSELPKTITKPFKNLKNYQNKCFEDTSKLLEPNMARAILQMPTGSGKTRTASEIISEHLNGQGVRQVVWLANTRELCEQAIQCMKEVWDHLGKRTCRYNRLWDGNLSKVPQWAENDCVFSVISLQGAWSFLRKDFNAFKESFQSSTLIIVDEAHIAVAPTYADVIRSLVRASDAKVLGLTATPGRTIKEENTSLSELFFGGFASLSDPDKNRNNSIAYLRSIGVMSQASHEEIKFLSSLEFSKAEQKNIENGEDYSERILKNIGSDASRTIEIIKELKKLLDSGHKIIMFAPSVRNSFLTSSILTFLGYKSIHISGATPPRTRDSLINKYINNEYQIICNYGVLATGFDAPNVDVVCIARPTLSPVLYSQMLGRGLRGKAVGGTSLCKIIEVRDNFVGQPNQDHLYKEFEDYWRE